MGFIRKNEVLILLGILLALPTFVFPIGVIRGFDIETQAIYLFDQDPFYIIALLFPLLSSLYVFLRRKAIQSPSTVFAHAVLSIIFCIDIVFLYFRFHFLKPDPTWVALTFLLGYVFIFLGNLKNFFFPYEFLRAYQPHLPVRLQAPPSGWEKWGIALLILGVLVGFQGYYSRFFLGQGPRIILIIAGIETTPEQRIQMMMGFGVLAFICGTLFLLKPKKEKKAKRG
ncbi:MAG: hypothetical protein D6736_14320 [Nitrospinota bacterium]|nr:MAG: hypothetical protein D6736_14320 [Nitrospinota bacterium]